MLLARGTSLHLTASAVGDGSCKAGRDVPGRMDAGVIEGRNQNRLSRQTRAKRGAA